jgi:hypothetical protein
MKARENIISNYIDAYNRFDVDGMVLDFDGAIKFENISNGKIDMSIDGLSKFREQAKQAQHIFTKRIIAVRGKKRFFYPCIPKMME